MYSFLKILIVVVLALVLIDWLAARAAERWTNIPNAGQGAERWTNVPGWASLSSNFKIRSAMANESPKGTAPLLDETFLPGDVEYQSPKGTVRIYFPIVTALVLSVFFTVFIGLTRKANERRI
jgi:hypothetical protein